MPNKKEEKRIEEEEEYTPLGEEEVKGGKSSLSKFMPVILPLAIALIVSYFMMSIMGVPKGLYNEAIVGVQVETAALREQATKAEETRTGLIGRVTTIEGIEPEVVDLSNYTTRPELDTLAEEVNALKAWQTGLGNPSAEIETKLAGYEAAIADYTVIIVDYEARITGMETLLEELGLIDEEGEVITHSETTRWTLDVYSLNHTDEVLVGGVASPSKIEEEGDYRIILTILNQTTTAIADLNLEIALRPRSGDRVIVDDGELYLDTIQSPYYFWDTGVVERNDETCRRVVFSCIGIGVKAGTGGGEEEPPFQAGMVVLRLDLTLAYK